MFYSSENRVLGIATRFGLEYPGIKCRWARDFPHPSRLALVPRQPPKNGQRLSFPEVKRPGRSVYHPPHLLPRLRSNRSKPLLHLWDFKDCSWANFTLMKIHLTFVVQGLRQLLVTDECLQTYVLQPDVGKRSSCRNIPLSFNMMHSSKPNPYLKVPR